MGENKLTVFGKIKKKVSLNAGSFVNGGRSATVTTAAGALALLNLLEGNLVPAAAAAAISAAHIENIIQNAKKIINDEQAHPQDGFVGSKVNAAVIAASGVNAVYNLEAGNTAGAVGTATIGLSFLLNNIYLDLKARGLDKKLNNPAIIAAIWSATAAGASTVAISAAANDNIPVVIAKLAIAIAHALGAVYMTKKYIDDGFNKPNFRSTDTGTDTKEPTQQVTDSYVDYLHL
jgi:hypothetical protein